MIWFMLCCHICFCLQSNWSFSSNDGIRAVPDVLSEDAWICLRRLCVCTRRAVCHYDNCGAGTGSSQVCNNWPSCWTAADICWQRFISHITDWPLWSTELESDTLHSGGWSRPPRLYVVCPVRYCIQLLPVKYLHIFSVILMLHLTFFDVHFHSFRDLNKTVKVATKNLNELCFKSICCDIQAMMSWMFICEPEKVIHKQES